MTATTTSSPSDTFAPISGPTFDEATACCNDASVSFDSAGIPFGTYIGFDFEFDHSIEVEYSADGVRVQYPELECGHNTALNVTVEGLRLEWFEIIDEGIENCELEGNVTLSFQGTPGQSLTEGSWLWEWNNINTDPGRAEMTFQCPDPITCAPTLSPSPTTLPTAFPTTLSTESPTPGPRTPAPTPQGPESKAECCDKASITFDGEGNPFGMFMGVELEVGFSIEINYSAGGVKARYPSLECGHINLLPVTIAPQVLMWMEIIDQGIDNCSEEGNVTMTFQGDPGESLIEGSWRWKWTSITGNTEIADMNFICPNPIPCEEDPGGNPPTPAPTPALRTPSPTASDGLEMIRAQLFTTGVDADGNVLDVGEDDPHYFIEEIQAPAKTLQDVDFWINGTDSMWIWENEEFEEAKTRTFVTTFDLTGYDHTTAKLAYDVAFDNILEIFLNNESMVEIGDVSCEFCGQYTTLDLDAGFLPTSNTLKFAVSSASGRAGLRIERISLFGKKSDDNIFAG